jgi:hypothetical protein
MSVGDGIVLAVVAFFVALMNPLVWLGLLMLGLAIHGFHG